MRPYGTSFTTSPIELSHLIQPGGFAAGYFLSVSLDVLGIVHFLFEQQQPTVRDVYTGERIGR